MNKSAKTNIKPFLMSSIMNLDESFHLESPESAETNLRATEERRVSDGRRNLLQWCAHPPPPPCRQSLATLQALLIGKAAVWTWFLRPIALIRHIYPCRWYLLSLAPRSTTGMRLSAHYIQGSDNWEATFMVCKRGSACAKDGMYNLFRAVCLYDPHVLLGYARRSHHSCWVDSEACSFSCVRQLEVCSCS